MQENYETLYQEYEDSRLISKYANYALWTVPSAFPEQQAEGTKGNMVIEHDYQSIGAALVNSLAPKLAGMLFPYNQPFFRITFTKEIKAYLTKSGKDPKEAEGALINMEQDAVARLFINGSYAQLIQAVKYLIITGNALIVRKDNKIIAYSPRNFSVLRDNNGDVLDVILKECTTYGSLDDNIRSLVEQGNKRKDFDEVKVFTRIKRKMMSKRVIFEVTKQINGIKVGQTVTYPERICPYIVAGWNLVNGDSYCRGMVEDYAGDFAKLSDLSRALALYEIDSCKVVNLVAAGANSDIDAFANAQNGEWLQAEKDAVTKHESGDAAKIQQLSMSIQNIFQRLASAFMYSANVRDAERVTAEEIRNNAIEADKVLGGNYSLISATVHEQLASLLCYEVNPEFIVAVNGGEIVLEMQTGTAALGRSADVQALLKSAQEIAAILPVLTQASKRFDAETLIDRILRSNGINVADYTFTEDQMQAKADAENAAVQQQQMAAAQQQQASMGGMGDPLQTTQAIQGVM